MLMKEIKSKFNKTAEFTRLVKNQMGDRYDKEKFQAVFKAESDKGIIKYLKVFNSLIKSLCLSISLSFFSLPNSTDSL